MKENNLKDLLDVLEEIRINEHPDIPKEVIEKIVLAQYENQDEQDRINGRNQTIKIIADYLNSPDIKEG